MNYPIPYTFGQSNGIHPDDWKRHKDQEAFETFLIKILGCKEYERRNQIRMMERAICTVVDELLMDH